VYKFSMLPLDRPVRYRMLFWSCGVDYRHGDCANPWRYVSINRKKAGCVVSHTAQTSMSLLQRRGEQ
jgi:hypothetical protein